MIKFALFGAGFIGKIHGANIAKHPQAELAYIYDVNAAAAEQLAAQLGSTVAASPEEIWASDVDAVLIASSTNTHAELLSGAIQAGKPTYCEKPIDLDIHRVKDVVQQAQQTDLPILVGFSRRFDANHCGVRQALQNGEIGKLEMMHITSRGPQPPPLSYVKVSGGQLRDQTIHFFDMLRWLAGEDPVEVYATGAALIDPAIGEAGDVDTSMVILKFASGALCHIDCSRRADYGYDERVSCLVQKEWRSQVANLVVRSHFIKEERSFQMDCIPAGLNGWNLHFMKRWVRSSKRCRVKKRSIPLYGTG